MERIACLLVDDPSLAAILRAEPDLRGRAVALVDGSGSRAVVLAASEEARAAGVAPGMTVAQARAVCPGSDLRAVSAEAERSAEGALLDAALSISPRVEAAGAGCAYAGVDGLGRLFASEREIAIALWRAARVAGLPARVAIAGGGKEVARALARAGAEITVVPPGGDRTVLAPLPVAVLGPSLEIAATLERFGIRRIGEMAALPAAQVVTRLGREGARLCALAAGVDGAPLVPVRPPEGVREAIDLDYAIERLEGLAFVLRPLLERLVVRLQARGLACAGLDVSLALEPRGRDERRIAALGPTRDTTTLLSLVRASLEVRAPGAAVRGVALTALAAGMRPEQLAFDAPPGPAPVRLAATLARLQALVGEVHVGAPVVPDVHFPGEVAIALFSPGARPAGDDRGGASLRPLALAAVRPPKPIEALFDGRELVALRGGRLGGRVVTLGGPQRIRAGVGAAAIVRDYYDVELLGGGLYRVYQDLQSGDFYVDGVYD